MDNRKYEVLLEKKQAQNLKFGDHIMVGDMLWRVVEIFRSMGSPNFMLQLAYHTHMEPRSFKFHAVRDEERFEVFRPID